MSLGSQTNDDLVRRFRQKFENLEETCMERYQTREDKVVTMMTSSVTSLEQLQHWAQYGVSPRDHLHASQYLNFVDFKYQCSIEPLRKLYDHLVLTDPQLAQDQELGETTRPDTPTRANGLKERLNYISVKYNQEGSRIRKVLTKVLQKYRRDIRTMYRWGQGSILELQDIMDDSMADELYCMVRAKMTRTLGTLGTMEDICEQVYSHHYKWFYYILEYDS